MSFRNRGEQGGKIPLDGRTGLGGFPPLRGVKKSKNPASIADNQFDHLLNVRLKRGILRERGGLEKAATNAFPGVQGVHDASDIGEPSASAYTPPAPSGVRLMDMFSAAYHGWKPGDGYFYLHTPPSAVGFIDAVYPPDGGGLNGFLVLSREVVAGASQRRISVFTASEPPTDPTQPGDGVFGIQYSGGSMATHLVAGSIARIGTDYYFAEQDSTAGGAGVLKINKWDSVGGGLTNIRSIVQADVVKCVLGTDGTYLFVMESIGGTWDPVLGLSGAYTFTTRKYTPGGGTWTDLTYIYTPSANARFTGFGSIYMAGASHFFGSIYDSTAAIPGSGWTRPAIGWVDDVGNTFNIDTVKTTGWPETRNSFGFVVTYERAYPYMLPVQINEIRCFLWMDNRGVLDGSGSDTRFGTWDSDILDDDVFNFGTATIPSYAPNFFRGYYPVDMAVWDGSVYVALNPGSPSATTVVLKSNGTDFLSWNVVESALALAGGAGGSWSDPFGRLTGRYFGFAH